MLTIALQAGGQSVRMGQDKALMPFLGIPLIQRLSDRFKDLGDEMLVITNQPNNYDLLDLPLYADTIPGRGALGGLLTALEVSKTDYVGLIAVDMPFSSPLLMAYLVEEIQSLGADAVIPSSAAGLEPLHAVYDREACTPLVKKAIQNDMWRMVSWHDQGHIRILDPVETARFTDSEHTFFNINTREDFQAAEKLAVRFNLY